MELVDGQQRITAVRAFLNGDILAYGAHFHEYEDRLPLHATFAFWVNNLPNRTDVLRWYLELNEGAIAHSPEELERVRQLLAQEQTREMG
ncbi:MAG: hypothetical protein GY803_22355 [Chloroflexi bacterium]|nr:hypothetical protein [Chloroflexota bacterium]